MAGLLTGENGGVIVASKYHESEKDKKLRKWFINDMTRGLLRGIKLKDGSLRGLTTFKINIDYPIIAIAGRNGAGKSTLLAIACCAYHNKNNGFKLKSRSKSYYTFSDFFVQYTEEIPPEGIDILYLFAHDHWKKSDDLPDGVGLAQQRRWKGKHGKWNDYAGRVKSDVIFLGIQRVVPHSERSQSKSYSKAFKDAGQHGWEGEIAEIVGYILGKNYSSLRYLTYSKYILPVVESSGIKYSGLNMGAGENALFEIFRILYSCSTGALIVIDEIELGLHIDAQRKLMRKLKDVCLNKKVQIICTTHSKEIFDALPNDARKYLECVNGATAITAGISSEFAMAKMGANEAKELEVLVEDGIASDILALALPADLRVRVRWYAVGSASALSRQLAAAYSRKDNRRIVVVFDGDQRVLEDDNLAHAKAMAELTGAEFEQWFRDRVSYLPGTTWPEAWLLTANKPFVASLCEHVSADANVLSDALEYGLQAGKHNELAELSGHLGLAPNQCVQALMLNLRGRSPEVFSELVDFVRASLA